MITKVELTDYDIIEIYKKHLNEASIHLDAASLTLALYKDKNVEYMQKKLNNISSKIIKLIKQMNE